MMASVGLPGTSGFVGEFLVLAGAFQANTWVALLAATGVILGAAYMLYLYRRVVFGELTKADVKAMLDLEPREIAIFAPVLIVIVWMGVYPMPFLDVTNVAVANIVSKYQAVVGATAEAPSAAKTVLAFLR
jgi:NADH-quinone oxidoreductase subunit M